MNAKHDYENDPIYVTTDEIKESLKEGSNKASMLDGFDISSETYNKLKKGEIKFARLGKNNAFVDIDEELTERKEKLQVCNYPMSKCICKKPMVVTSN